MSENIPHPIVARLHVYRLKGPEEIRDLPEVYYYTSIRAATDDYFAYLHQVQPTNVASVLLIDHVTDNVMREWYNVQATDDAKLQEARDARAASYAVVAFAIVAFLLAAYIFYVTRNF